VKKEMRWLGRNLESAVNKLELVQCMVEMVGRRQYTELKAKLPPENKGRH